MLERKGQLEVSGDKPGSRTFASSAKATESGLNGSQANGARRVRERQASKIGGAVLNGSSGKGGSPARERSAGKRSRADAQAPRRSPISGSHVNGVRSNLVRIDGAGLGDDPGRWEVRFHQLVGLASDPFLETDGEATATEWNEQAERVFGWRRAEVVGRPVADLLLPDRHQEKFSDQLEGLRRRVEAEGVVESRPQELYLVHRDGHEVHVLGTVYAVQIGGEVRIGGFLHDLSSEDAADEALAHAQLYDALTGLPNRTLFTFRLTRALASGNGSPGEIAVLVVDLDRFKGINDALGYEVGDEVLVTVAQRILESDGSADLIARLGGDVFLALFEGEDAEPTASAFARRVLQAISEPLTAGGTEVFVTASIGIASTAGSGSDSTSLLANADSALHEAKQRGGGSLEVFGEAMRVHVLNRTLTEHSLHRALERAELQLFYQPVVDIHGERAVGVEALLRWNHPDQGLVFPDKFIPVAEESGLIIPIGAWVMREACEQLERWRVDHWSGPNGAMEVNLSARQIDHPDVVETVERILAQTGVMPANLTLEITESALMNDAKAALEVLRALKSLGVTLAIDDFGTGYSSLSYLQRFPLDILKVDKSFVDTLGMESEGSEIVAAVINLAHALGLQVIAEGVETEQQLEVLQRLDCDFAQGYLFSRPVPATDLVAKFPLRLGV